MKRFWKDLKGHYKYALYAAKSELKSEVANSYLNWIWWVLEPFCFMLIYSFIFCVVLNAKEPNFIVFILTEAKKFINRYYKYIWFFIKIIRTVGSADYNKAF